MNSVGIAGIFSASALIGISACATRPPTIAHVHVGHAVTGVHVTPEKNGYFIEAERRAADIYDLAQRARRAGDLARIKADIAAVVKATADGESFGLKHSLLMAANHLSFAATSADASLNLQEWALGFTGDIAAVVQRCELIELLGHDVAASLDKGDALLLVEEIEKLSLANLKGDDSNGDGKVGSLPAEFGLAQLRARIDAMVAQEQPPYVPVDQWFLFNLVRLPNGRWVFDKFGRGGSIEGYK